MSCPAAAPLPVAQSTAAAPPLQEPPAMKSLCRLLLPLLALAWAAVAADSDPDAAAKDTWMKGYQSYEAGDTAEKGRRYPDALDRYRESLGHMEAVRAQAPNYNPFMVDYRITDLKKRIARLEPVVAQLRATLPKEEVKELNVTLEARLQSSLAKTQELEKQLLQNTEALSKARAEAARAAELMQELEKLTWKSRDLTKDNETLRAKVTELAAEMEKAAKQPAVSQALLDLQREWELAKRRADEATTARAALEKELEDTRLKLQRASWERNQAQAGVDVERAATKTLQAQVRDLDALLVQSKNTTADLQARLKAGQDAALVQEGAMRELKAALARLKEESAVGADLKQEMVAREEEAVRLRELVQKLLAARDDLTRTIEQDKRDLDALQLANQRLRQAAEQEQKQMGSKGEELTRLRQAQGELAAKLEVAARRADEAAKQSEEQLRVARLLQAELTALKAQQEQKATDSAALQQLKQEFAAQTAAREQSLADLRQNPNFPNQPTEWSFPASFELPSNASDNFNS